MSERNDRHVIYYQWHPMDWDDQEGEDPPGNPMKELSNFMRDRKWNWLATQPVMDVQEVILNTPVMRWLAMVLK